MRKLLIPSLALAAAAALALAATAAGARTSGAAQAAIPGCAKGSLNLVEDGVLTVGADNPAFPPWFGGAEKTKPWKVSDPYSGKGYESAVAYAVAKQLGFTKAQVKWTVVPFNNSFRPGKKPFDVYITQVSYAPERAKAVDFSMSYYYVNQAVVGRKGKPISKVKSVRSRDGLPLRRARGRRPDRQGHEPRQGALPGRRTHEARPRRLLPRGRRRDRPRAPRAADAAPALPDGIAGEQIYQKRVPEKRPEWVEVARVTIPSGRHADELCVTELAQVISGATSR